MKDLLIAVVIVLAVSIVLWSTMTVCRRKHPAWETLKRYRYAHRGYHDKPTIPENSMTAFRRAVEHGWGADFYVTSVYNLSLEQDRVSSAITGKSNGHMGIRFLCRYMYYSGE